MWEPPEYPGPCFDLHFDRFDGFIFEAEKPFENVCATGASPVQLREYLFLHLFDCKPQNIVAVVVHESATAQEAVLLDGVAAKGETVITFLELRIQKKSEKRPRKWARNSDPFLVPLSIGIFPEGSENGRIWGLHFGAGEPLSSSFLESHNLDAERPFLQQHAPGELQSVAS